MIAGRHDISMHVYVKTLASFLKLMKINYIYVHICNHHTQLILYLKLNNYVSYFFIKYVGVLGGVHMCVQGTGDLWRSENILGELVLSFYHVSHLD